MRSLASHLTIAVLAFAVGTTGALAASGDHDHGRGHEHGNRTSFDHSNAPDNDGWDAPSYAYGPRLSMVLHELRVDDQRLNTDRSYGRLSAAQFARLKNDESRIRAEAIGAADRNGGTIPAGQYGAIQNQVRTLGRMA